MRHLFIAAAAAVVFATPASAALISYFGEGYTHGTFTKDGGEPFANWAEFRLDIVVDTETMSCGTLAGICTATLERGGVAFNQSDADGQSFSIFLKSITGADPFSRTALEGTFTYSNRGADSQIGRGTVFWADSAFTSRAPTAVVSLAAVPEPASWAMMIAGFGLAGASMRRRRVHAATS